MATSKAKQDLDWANLGFKYRPTKARFSAIYRNGAWSEGALVESPMIEVHEGAPALHYAQQCFEGMKAQTAPDGRRTQRRIARQPQGNDRSCASFW